MIRGDEHAYDESIFTDFIVKDEIATAKDYLEHIGKSFIYNKNEMCTPHTISDLRTVYHGHELNVDALFWQLMKEKNMDDICDKDEDWTKWRNKKYLSEFYVKYTLKPAYQKMFKEKLLFFISKQENLLKQIQQKRLEKEEAIEQRKSELMKDVLSFNTEEKATTDEDGKTVFYVSTVSFKNGEQFTFQDRNIFDFGHVINPKYSIDGNSLHVGGIALHLDNDIHKPLWWHYFCEEG